MHLFLNRAGSGWHGIPRAVTIGIVLQDSLVDLLPEREDYAAAMLYRHNSYDVVNLALDQIALAVANIIQRAGYGALPVPASKRASDEKIAGVFSQKLAAHLAGLGWIGKSCLLVTPDHGPRVRWVTVLTDAPLAPTGSPMEQRCGKCTQCTDACPKKAITAGHSARTSHGRPGSMQRHATSTSGRWRTPGHCRLRDVPVYLPVRQENTDPGSGRAQRTCKKKRRDTVGGVRALPVPRSHRPQPLRF